LPAESTDPTEPADATGHAEASPFRHPLVTISTLELVGAAVLAIAWFALFHRVPIGSGFGEWMGYTSDTRLAVYLVEHWYQVLSAGRPWRSPTMFAPVEGTLGYTDGFLLHSLPYLPLRALGVGQTVAFGLAQMMIAALAMWSCYHLARRWLQVRPIVASALACLAVLPNALFTQAGHAQLFVLHWLPVIAVILCAGLARPATVWWYVALFASSLLAGLVAISGFYMAWFTLVALAIFAVLLLALEHRAVLAMASHLPPRRVAASAGAVAAGLAGPAWIVTQVYLPVVSSGMARTTDDAAIFEMELRHILNVGPDNLLWGWLHQETVPGLLGREWMMGFPPGFLVTIAVGALLVWRARTSAGPRMASSAALALAGTAVALVLLPVRFGSWAPWRAVATVVPGGEAIRAPGRMWLVAALVGVACLAACAHVLAFGSANSTTRSRLGAVGTALALLLVLEHVNGDTSQRVLVETEERLEQLAATTPASCKTFFAVGAPSDGAPWGVHLDAMTVSMFNGIPTLNGYSGFEPDGFPPLPGTQHYPTAMREWAASNNLAAGLCELDLTDGRWSAA
jgi:hypothetical protein